MFKFFLDGKLRNNSSGISALHKIFDSIFIIFIFLINIEIQKESNIYIYAFTIFVISDFILKDLYKSFRTSTLSQLLWQILIKVIIMITFLSAFNFFVGYEKNIIYSLSIKSIILSIYFFISHIFSRFILRIYRSRGGNTRTIMILGNLDFRKKINQELTSYPWMGFKVIKWFACTNNFANWPIKPDGKEKDMKIWIKKNRPDLIIFSQDDITNPIGDFLKIFGDTSCSISYYSNWLNPSMNLKPITFGDIKIISIWNKPQSLIQLTVKEFFDKLFALILILILLPFFILISILIKITTQQEFLYTQNRIGLNGEEFKIYKFRTMNIAESGKKPNLKQASQFDERITKIGRFLRKYSLDELPQLFNVLEGKMSLVGPRPHAVSHNEFYRSKITSYMQRHRIKPGITGLAQVKGFRGETKSLNDMEQRIFYDLKYINDWTLILDIEILINTIFNLKANK